MLRDWRGVANLFGKVRDGGLRELSDFVMGSVGETLRFQQHEETSDGEGKCQPVREGEWRRFCGMRVAVIKTFRVTIMGQHLNGFWLSYIKGGENHAGVSWPTGGVAGPAAQGSNLR